MNEKFKDTDLREALRRNYANVPQLPEGGLSLRPLQGEKELKRRRFPFIWSGLGGGLSIAASILIAFLLWPKGDEAPITQPEIQQQPVVAEAHESHEPYESQPPQPQQPHKPHQPAAEPESTPLATREGQGESPLVESLPLLAEAQNTPIPEELGESPVELPVLPPDRQALVDMFLAEEALQVAYMQQEQTKELRAFTAGLEGKEPETSHLIIAF